LNFLFNLTFFYVINVIVFCKLKMISKKSFIRLKLLLNMYIKLQINPSIVAWEIVYTILKNMVSRKMRLKFHYLISCGILPLISHFCFKMNLPLHLAMLFYASIVQFDLLLIPQTSALCFGTLVSSSYCNPHSVKFNTCIIKRMLG